MEIKTGLDAYDIALLLNKVGYRYGVPRRERARAWEGHEVGRIYFGKDYITIKDGVATNRDLHKVRACTACDDAMNAINAVLGNDSTDRVRSARADDDSRRRKEPIEMPDGTKCYTEGCERHEDRGEGVTAKDEIQLSTGKHLKPASYFNEEEKEAWRRIVKNPAAKELLELVADDSQETAQSDKPVVYRKTTQEECDDIRKQAAEQNNPLPEKFNLEEYEHTINGAHITHSLKRHGHGRSGGQLKREDFALVPEIIDNPDKRTYRHKVYEDGRIERSVRYLKNFGNRSYTYVEHLLSPPTSKKSSKKRELAMVTAWLDVQKKG